MEDCLRRFSHANVFISRTLQVHQDLKQNVCSKRMMPAPCFTINIIMLDVCRYKLMRILLERVDNNAMACTGWQEMHPSLSFLRKRVNGNINIVAPTKGNVHKRHSDLAFSFTYLYRSIGFEISSFKLIVSKKILQVLFARNLTENNEMNILLG